jgi:hypothetical protein
MRWLMSDGSMLCPVQFARKGGTNEILNVVHARKIVEKLSIHGNGKLAWGSCGWASQGKGNQPSGYLSLTEICWVHTSRFQADQFHFCTDHAVRDSDDCQ